MNEEVKNEKVKNEKVKDEEIKENSIAKIQQLISEWQEEKDPDWVCKISTHKKNANNIVIQKYDLATMEEYARDQGLVFLCESVLEVKPAIYVYRLKKMKKLHHRRRLQLG